MLEEASCILRLPIENHITCKICGKEFTSKKCFWRHRKYHKEGQKCQCPICLQWFISQTLLNVHMQNHKDRKTFDCQVCGKTLASKQSFVFHQETHVKVTSSIFKCSLCPKDFPDERRLTVHKHTHSRNRESCALCTMNYPNKASLKKHKDAMHRKITFLCEICNVKFSSKGSLKSHQKTHREERAFIYVNCAMHNSISQILLEFTPTRIMVVWQGQTFIHAASALRNSILLEVCNGMKKAIHQGIRYPCSICPHEAKVKKELQVHKRRHMGEKQYRTIRTHMTIINNLFVLCALHTVQEGV